MRTLIRVSLVLVVGLAAGACVHRFHDDDDVTVELERLAPFQGGCIVRGTVRNDDDHTVRVFFTWRALDRDDDVIGTAEAEVPTFRATAVGTSSPPVSASSTAT